MVCWAHPTATAPEVQGSPQRLWQGSVVVLPPTHSEQEAVPLTRTEAGALPSRPAASTGGAGSPHSISAARAAVWSSCKTEGEEMTHESHSLQKRGPLLGWGAKRGGFDPPPTLTSTGNTPCVSNSTKPLILKTLLQHSPPAGREKFWAQRTGSRSEPFLQICSYTTAPEPSSATHGSFLLRK